MSTNNQSRALMLRHHKMVRNREQSMLKRAASDIGVDIDVNEYRNHIQGKIPRGFSTTYDRSNASMS